MKTFKDTNQTEWTVDVTVLDVKKLREKAGIRLTDPDQLATLLEDEEKLFEILWLLVADQAKEQNIDAEQFAKRITKVYLDAMEALVGAISDFFQSLGRTELHVAIGKISSALKKQRENVASSLSSAKMDQTLTHILSQQTKKLDDMMDRLMNESNESTSTT